MSSCNLATEGERDAERSHFLRHVTILLHMATKKEVIIHMDCYKLLHRAANGENDGLYVKL